ncbi:hypothetical protein [Pontibacter fetidus]|uniref:STAS/SEC14 domain-containing protein n=1 Tax=Pontibacter fetidus TaxID=2700082 RepID=A0A6B2GZJ7_9BACT|nr:hypothetical protein [Pontibacter fetidus]NDK55461.1 hypothetical protein [Pontibacter fetidus]
MQIAYIIARDGMVVHSSTYSDIIFDSELEILQVIWKAKPTDSAFKETYLQGLSFVQEVQPVMLYCTDLTIIGPLEREQEAWLNNVFYGKLHDAVKQDVFTAVVFTEAHFKAIITNYAATEAVNTQDFMLFNYFTDRAEALHWLESVKKGQDASLFPISLHI